MALPEIVIVTKQAGPRLRYVLDWLLTERLGLAYSLTTDGVEATDERFVIGYGVEGNSGISIPSSGLLEEDFIKEHNIPQGDWQGFPTLYQNAESGCDIPFDLFSAAFFLLSRYEEYYPFTPDAHGRYPHTESVLWKAGMLERPVLDEWVEMLRNMLALRWHIVIPAQPASFNVTYDIDIAWSYLHKGWKRALGAGFRALTRFDFKEIKQRFQVHFRSGKDPYDAFEWMKILHRGQHIKPQYFVLAAFYTDRYDKNISPRNPAMQQLIAGLDGPVGLHPSYNTATNFDRLLREKAALEKITKQRITQSRQHYIRLRLPDTFHALQQAGITDDRSMGYSTALGFRAGTGHSFLWYDLQNETTAALRIHPFCFMDTTAHFDLKLSPEESFFRLRQMWDSVQSCHGALTTIFHNFSLGSDAEWVGWRDAYAGFLAKNKTLDLK